MSATDSAAAKALGERFDPFADWYLDDPYPFLAEARAAAPVFYSPALDYWVVTRYHDVRQIFDDPRRFSATNALKPVKPLCPEAVSMLTERGFRATPTLTDRDPPAHTRVRRLANVAFSHRWIDGMEPFIREVTRRFMRERFLNGRVDLVKDLAYELPALVLFRVLGIPDEDVPLVKRLGENRVLLMWGRPTAEEQMRLAEGTVTLWHYAERHVASRVEHPRDDFISDLAAARDGELPALAPQELATITYGLLLAGHETTTSLLANAFRRFLENRDAWGEICGDPSLIPNAVDEVLRLDPSIIAWRRKTLQPVEIGGVSVPADAGLLLMQASANRDPSVFPDPDRFDIRRRNAKNHLAFGHGPHFCLGAPLAQLEARIVLEEVSSRLPSLRLVAGQTLRFSPNTSFRGPMSLLAEWDA